MGFHICPVNLKKKLKKVRPTLYEGMDGVKTAASALHFEVLLENL
jgi:hypothetical protein